MPTVAELDVQIDATNKASDELAKVDAQIKRLDGQDVDVDIDADGNAAEREFRKVLAAIRAAARAGAEIPVGLDDDATKELAALQARLRALAREKHTVEIDVEMQQIRDQIKAEALRIKVEADTAKAQARLAQLDAFADSIDAMIKVGANDAVVRAKIAALKAAIAALDRNIDLDMDTAGLHAKLALLEGHFKAVDDAAREASRSVDEGGRNGGRGLDQLSLAAERAGGNVRGLIAAGLALWPAMIPLAGAAAAAVGGFGLAATLAGAGTGLFAAVAVTNFNDITEAINKIETAQRAADVAITDKARENALKRVAAEYENLTESQAGAVRELMAFKTEWRDFAGQFEPQVFGLAANGLGLLREIFPQLAPMVGGVATAFDNLINKARGALAGPFWQDFISMLNEGAGPAVETLFTGFGNLFEGLIGMFSAFFPFQDQWNAGFIGMTEKFREWGTTLGQSEGFRNFMAYAAEAIPRANAFLGALMDALVAIVRAVAPYGDVVLSALTGFLNAITWIGQQAPILLLLAAAASGLTAAFIALLGPIASVLNVARLLFLAFGGAGGAVAKFLLILSGVGAVVALAVGSLIYAYTHFDSFRNIVDRTAAAIVGAFQSAIAWLQAELQPAVQAVGVFLAQEWAKWVVFAQEMINKLKPVWDGMRRDLEVVMAIIKAMWAATWAAIKTVVETVWPAIKNIVSAAMEVIRGVIEVIVGLITSDWDTFWSGIQRIAKAGLDLLFGIIDGALRLIVGLFQGAWNGLKAFLSGVWNSMSSETQQKLASMVAEVAAKMVAFMESVRSSGPRILEVLMGILRDMVAAPGGFANRLAAAGASLIGNFIEGVRSRVGEAVALVRGAVQQIADLMPGSPAETGPLSGQGYTRIRGEHLVEDFAEGMRRRASDVARTARDVADLATLAASPEVAFGRIATGSFSGQRNAGGVNLAPGAVTLTVQVGEGVSVEAARSAFNGAGEDLAEKLALALRRE